jgi:uncharacterized protein YbjT (DUF2867 family)
MAAVHRFLIAGATGKQGGAVISSLLKSPPSTPYQLVALTRNPSSARAQRLASQPNVALLEGDMDDCVAIFAKATQQYGANPFQSVFSVQIPLKPKVEEAQGKALVDAAAANGVRHFVYTSADRGGEEKSDRDPTPVAHFASKYRIEEHLKEVAGRTRGMQWSIVRPVAFMENLTDNFLGKGFQSMWELNGMDSKLQLISSTDVGLVAAEMLKAPQKWHGKAVSLASDELTPTEARKIFRTVVGSEIPSTYSALARLLKWGLKEQLGDMFNWFKESGFGADIAACRQEWPQLKGFEDWLKQSSDWSDRVSRR